MALSSRILESIDNALRHRAVLGRLSWLRDLLRKPYHRLMNVAGEGLSLQLGGHIPVRVPAEFASKWMESYEADEFGHIRQWMGSHPGGVFVDVGCSQGYMSCAALFCDGKAQVFAIDSDLNSLKTTGRVCQFAPGGGGRLHLLYGMIVGNSSEIRPWRQVEEMAMALLDNPQITGDPNSHQYVCLNQEAGQGVPRHSLDALFEEERGAGRPMLIKCDVEGAEYEVLAGCRGLMRESRPEILLSVHPEKLPALGHTADMVKDLLAEAGYVFREFAVDHEHHWLCSPR
jgi:FkbM family methyltransferase